MASDRNMKVKAVFKLMRTLSYLEEAPSYWREMAQQKEPVNPNIDRKRASPYNIDTSPKCKLGE